MKTKIIILLLFLIISMSLQAQGKFVKLINYDENEIINSTQDFVYNEQDQLIGIRDYDSEGNIKFRYEYSYDNQNYMVEEIGFNNIEEFKFSKVFKNDRNGNQIEGELFDNEHKSLGVNYGIYNEQNKKVETNGFDENGKMDLFQKYYYENNNIIRKEHFEDYELNTLFIYKYEGNIIEMEVFDSEGDYKHSYLYEFNDKNNLAKIYYKYMDENPILSSEIIYEKSSINYDAWKNWFLRMMLWES